MRTKVWNTGAHRFTIVLASLLIVGFTGSAFAQGKDALYQELVQLGQQLTALKPQTDDAETLNQFNALLADYVELSNQFGGDDPAGLLSGSGRLAGDGANLAPAAPPGGATVTANFPNNTPTAIPDGPGGTASSMITVAGAGTYLWDLDLTMDLTHTFAADLDITLMSPAGTVATLTTDNGGGNDNVFSGTLWDDQSPQPSNTATDFIYANLVTATPLVPEGAFGAFIGEDPNGTWTITMMDDAGLDTGTLNSWSLDVTTLAAAPVNAMVSGTNNTPTAIPDGPGGVANHTVTVAGAGTFLCDLNMTTDITHTFAADLDITLMSPAGTVVTITTDNGGGNDNVFSGTLWDDDAPQPSNTATDFIYANLVTATPLTPEGALARFIGEDPNGTWTLTVMDDAGLDTGTINSVTLDVTTCMATVVGGGGTTLPVDPNVPTLSPLGLVALLLLLAAVAFFVMRRRAA